MDYSIRMCQLEPLFSKCHRQNRSGWPFSLRLVLLLLVCLFPPPHMTIIRFVLTCLLQTLSNPYRMHSVRPHIICIHKYQILDNSYRQTSSNFGSFFFFFFFFFFSLPLSFSTLRSNVESSSIDSGPIPPIPTRKSAMGETCALPHVNQHRRKPTINAGFHGQVNVLNGCLELD